MVQSPNLKKDIQSSASVVQPRTDSTSSESSEPLDPQQATSQQQVRPVRAAVEKPKHAGSKRIPVGSVTENHTGPGGIDLRDFKNLNPTPGGYQFSVVYFLASGAYGAVYEIEARESYRRVEKYQMMAVKILKTIKSDEMNDEERKEAKEHLKNEIKNEFNVMMRIMDKPHANLLDCLEIFSVDNYDRGYMIMEMCELGTLKQVQKRDATNGCFAADEAKWLVKNIAAGVDHLHKLLIAHCDLKPDNVLLFLNPDVDDYSNGVVNRFIPRVVDFSNSQVKKPDQGDKWTKGILCTIQWGSPEAYVRKTRYDGFKLDVYSLACILHFNLTGRSLFDVRANTNKSLYADDHLRKFVKQQTNDKIRERLKNPIINKPEMLDLLRKSLEEDSNKRISVQQFLQHPFFK